MFKISFADGLGITGIVLSIVLVALDKSGKLKGPVPIVLLAIAAAMTLPLAVGNSWVSGAGSTMLKTARGMLMVFGVGMVFSCLLIWISTGNDTAKEDDKETGIDPHGVQLSLTCDTLNLPLPYHGDIWFLETIFLNGLAKLSPNPLKPDGLWPEKNAFGTGYRCVVRNYGTETAFGVIVGLEAQKANVVKEKDGSQHGGTIIEKFTPLISVPQPLGPQDTFTFYVCSFDPEKFIEITLPTSALINGDDEQRKRRTTLRTSSTLGNPIVLAPQRILTSLPKKSQHR